MNTEQHHEELNLRQLNALILNPWDDERSPVRLREDLSEETLVKDLGWVKHRYGKISLTAKGKKMLDQPRDYFSPLSSFLIATMPGKEWRRTL